MVQKGGFEPPRSRDRQPLKLEAVNVDRSRPRKIGVGRPSWLPTEVGWSASRPIVLQILARARWAIFDDFITSRTDCCGQNSCF